MVSFLVSQGTGEGRTATGAGRIAEALAAVPTAVFQASLSSATDDGPSQAAEYVEAFVEETEWHPDRIDPFGGALRYSGHGLLERPTMRRIVERTLPDVATDRDVGFTDRAEVEAFANGVAASVEDRLGVGPAGAGDAERDG